MVLVFCAITGFAGGFVALAPPSYNATVLPQLDTTDSKFKLTYTTPFAMNDARQVVGDTGDGQGFVWSPGDGGSGLRSIFGGSADRVVGTGINSAGAICGSYAPAGEFTLRPFYFSESGDLTLLPTLAPEFGAGAVAMNDHGLIVGSGANGPGGTFGGPQTSLIWQNGQVFDIGGFGGDASVATGVNNNNVVVGWSNHRPGEAAAPYRWTQGGGMVEMEQFIDGVPALPTDINDNGIVVGHAGLSLFSNTAVYWDAAGEIHELGRLDISSIDIDVRALNNDGVMVGMELDSSSFVPSARLWLDGEVYDLNDLVVDLPDGFALRDAVDINGAGDIIVEAERWVDGRVQFYSVLLTVVPGPGPLGVLAAGCLTGVRRRR